MIASFGMVAAEVFFAHSAPFLESSHLAIHSRTTGDLRRGPEMTRCINGVPCLPLFLDPRPDLLKS